jgi:hypothetical protein
MNWTMNSRLNTSCQSCAMVVENGTMNASLVMRPAISQMAMPAAMLSQNGAWRRIAVFNKLRSCAAIITVIPGPAQRARAKRGTVGPEPGIQGQV